MLNGLECFWRFYHQKDCRTLWKRYALSTQENLSATTTSKKLKKNSTFAKLSMPLDSNLSLRIPAIKYYHFFFFFAVLMLLWITYKVLVKSLDGKGDRKWGNGTSSLQIVMSHFPSPFPTTRSSETKHFKLKTSNS